MRQRRPDLNEALRYEIDPAAEIALDGARRDADDGRHAREDEAEENRDAEAVDQPRDDVAALVVGAEPIPFEVAAGRVRLRRIELLARRLADVVRQPPRRRGRRRRRQVALMRAIREA